MHKHLLFLAFISLVPGIRLFAQGTCNPAGNIIIYSNYDGGTLTIEIDENIPDIRIGLCSYEDLHVTITGAYAGNVTQVLYAGYNDDGTTSVTGVDAGIVDILVYPEVYLYDPDGNEHMVCAYECDTAYVPGGCNTVDQATNYFLTELPGSIRYSYFQYGVWSGTYDFSEGGNCCVDAECVIAIDAGQDVNICEGESATLNSTGALNYDWYDAGSLVDCTEPCDEIIVTPTVTTTYIVYGTDADECSGIDSVTVYVYPYPVAEITYLGGELVASGGGTYQWYFEGDLIPGATDATYTPIESGIYTVLVTSDAGCEDMSDEFAFLNSIEGIEAGTISVFPNPANDILFIETTFSVELLFELTSINGEIITAISNFDNGLSSINTSGIASGVYVLKITAGSGIISKQVVIRQ